jgi:hypothetical protein
MNFTDNMVKKAVEDGADKAALEKLLNKEKNPEFRPQWMLLNAPKVTDEPGMQLNKIAAQYADDEETIAIVSEAKKEAYEKYLVAEAAEKKRLEEERAENKRVEEEERRIRIEKEEKWLADQEAEKIRKKEEAAAEKIRLEEEAAAAVTAAEKKKLEDEVEKKKKDYEEAVEEAERKKKEYEEATAFITKVNEI